MGKLRIWRDKALAWLKYTWISVLLWILRINDWLNVASIGVLVFIGVGLGLVVILAMTYAGVHPS